MCRLSPGAAAEPDVLEARGALHGPHHGLGAQDVSRGICDWSVGGRAEGVVADGGDITELTLHL